MEVNKTMGELTHIQQQTAIVLTKLEHRFLQSPDIGAKPGFQERAVTKAIEQAFRINNNAEVKGALTRLFGQELAALDIPLTNLEGEKVNLYDALIENVLDGGTIKDRSCLVPFGGELVPFHEKASPILTRSAFISRVLGEHRKQNELRRPDAEGGPSEHHVSIGMIDLHNLRGADFEIEGQVDKPADVLVNKAARAIRDAFKKLGYTDPTKLEKENKSWELGRYGGDEFVFGLFGDFSQEEREALYREIQKQLASDNNMSYYTYLDVSGDPVIKKERILLKELNANHNVVDVIQFPDDHEPLQINQMIFLALKIVLIILENNIQNFLPILT
ncbi:MAG: hypothetical protein NTZ55_05825 [Candidatus Roizmanbacteria bacterium]|nr:hypothetical protein [Candidatus Roizmanbacteria bacterium]